MLTILHYISGPVIGALIGAFTNYIAIKMLFRPLKPVMIGKFRLPLTPGVIPRHQKALAEAISETVYQNFFTNSDIEGIFLTEEMTQKFSEEIYGMIEGIELGRLSDSISEDSKMKIKEAVYRKVHRILETSDISGMISRETEKIIRTKVKGGLVSSLILSDEIVRRISAYVGREVEDYVIKNDLDLMYPILTKQSEELKSRSVTELMEESGLEKEALMEAIKSGYREFMGKAKTKIAETFHIKEFIYNKIIELDPGEIERLVNTAINREMSYLVYLGGALGFIIGIVNIFI